MGFAYADMFDVSRLYMGIEKCDFSAWFRIEGCDLTHPAAQKRRLNLADEQPTL